MDLSAEKDALKGKLEELKQLDSEVANALRGRLDRELRALRANLSSIESLAEYEEKAKTVYTTIRKDAQRSIDAQSK